jgi:DNA-binding PadR family transcriptional regulator
MLSEQVALGLPHWAQRLAGGSIAVVSAHPLCPVVLALLASRPQRVHEVAAALTRTQPHLGVDRYAFALGTLERLRGHGLVRSRPGPSAPIYQITARGRRELWLHRRVRAAVLRALHATA